jgi:hypothetical protein
MSILHETSHTRTRRSITKPRQNSLHQIGEISRPCEIGASHDKETLYLLGSAALPHTISVWLLDEAAVYR